MSKDGRNPLLDPQRDYPDFLSSRLVLKLERLLSGLGSPLAGFRLLGARKGVP